MVRPTTPFAAAPALSTALLLLLRGAAAFQLWLNTDSLSGEPVPPEAAAAVEGLLGPPAAAAAASFGDVPRILAQPWDQWVSSDGAATLQDFAGPGLDADEVYLWGQGRTMLTPEQLDTVAASPAVGEAIIAVKTFGPKLINRDAVTPSIDHPACSGVAMEVTAGYWCTATDSPRQPHFTAARYAAHAGKRLFIAPPATVAAAALPQQMECLADALHGALGGDFFCSDSLRIVSPASGGVLALRDKRAELCASGGDAAVAGVAAQVDDDVDDDEDRDDGVLEGDGARVHASGLTVDEIFSSIKSRRQAGRRRKMILNARRVRRSRRKRGMGRMAGPTVATRIVAVDADGKAVGGGDTDGAVLLQASAAVEEDEEEETVEGGPGRSWWQCMKDCMKACCDGMKACCDGMKSGMKACCEGMKACCDSMKSGMKACCEGVKACTKACCKAMKDGMKACCDGMKKCCEGMKDCMKACCEGMRSCMKACCDGMKACCDGMKACMKACCEGMKACCDGMKDCMKACCEGMSSAVKAACKCMKKVIGFVEEADEHEAH